MSYPANCIVEQESIGLAVQLREARAEVERLRAESEKLWAEFGCPVCGRGRGVAGSPLCDCPDPVTVAIEPLRAQVDALADALFDCGAFISTTALQLPPEDREPHRQAVLVKLDAALKLAGRL